MPRAAKIGDIKTQGLKTERLYTVVFFLCPGGYAHFISVGPYYRGQKDRRISSLSIYVPQYLAALGIYHAPVRYRKHAICDVVSFFHQNFSGMVLQKLYFDPRPKSHLARLIA